MKGETMAPSDCFLVEITLRVRYKETDMMGFVHHSNYVAYFEEARSEYARRKGTPYSEFEKAGYFLAVTEINIRYIKPAYYEQKIIVRTWLTALRSRGLTFEYEIVDQDSGNILVKGHTKHICITRDGQATKLPDRWRAWE